MHRVFRNVLLPKVGNQDEIHGYLVDLMVAMKTMVGTGATFDVSLAMILHEESLSLTQTQSFVSRGLISLYYSHVCHSHTPHTEMSFAP